MDWMRWRVRLGFFVVIVTYVAVVLSIFLGCRPFHANWQMYPDPGSTFSFHHCRNKSLIFWLMIDNCQPAVSHINLLVTLVLNIISDVYLLSIPLPVSLANQSIST